MVYIKTFLSLIIFSLGIGIVNATPVWMDLGTYAITDDDNGTPPCKGGRRDLIDLADAFYEGAVANHPNGPTPSRYPYANLSGNNMTIFYLNDGNGFREYCDFVFAGAHGFTKLLAVWSDDKTSCVHWVPATMHFGSRYNRWVYFFSCDVLYKDPNDNNFFSDWNPAFNGVQVILGFGSIVVFDKDIYLDRSYIPKDMVRGFWSLWAATSNQMGIWDAHKEATNRWYYRNDWSVRPACISSQRSTQGRPHIYLYDTYSNATSEAGMHYAACYMSVDYGTPQL
jgi:hypothetical protein